jgi:hypothetical protein
VSGNGEYLGQYADSGAAARETIFEDGAWKIKALPGQPDMWDTVHHKCAWKKNWLLKDKGLSVYTMDTQSICPHCSEPIPESIQGLWKLKMMDKLQALHQSQAEYKNKGWGGGFYLHGTATPKPPYGTDSGGAQRWVGRPGGVWEYDPKAGPPTPISKRPGANGKHPL